jgi:ABC-type transporter MlaC component
MNKLEFAKQAINDLFSDTKAPRSQTREDLEELREEIETLLDLLQGDD